MICVNSRYLVIAFLLLPCGCAKNEAARPLGPLPDDASHVGGPAAQPTWETPPLDLPSLTTGRVKRTPGKVSSWVDAGGRVAGIEIATDTSTAGQATVGPFMQDATNPILSGRQQQAWCGLLRHCLSAI